MLRYIILHAALKYSLPLIDFSLFVLFQEAVLIQYSCVFQFSVLLSQWLLMVTGNIITILPLHHFHLNLLHKALFIPCKIHKLSTIAMIRNKTSHKRSSTQLFIHKIHTCMQHSPKTDIYRISTIL